jgi:hypothetical protein
MGISIDGDKRISILKPIERYLPEKVDLEYRKYFVKPCISIITFGVEQRWSSDFETHFFIIYFEKLNQSS